MKIIHTLNSNIRCIEILMLDCGLRRKEVLNSNIRCIEIGAIAYNETAQKTLNSNIRCIEITVDKRIF